MTWCCLRCGADASWINRRRTKCLRCGADRSWLEKHMAKHKPDAAENIAKWTHSWHPAAFKGVMFDSKLSAKIRRAISRAVAVERRRCIAIVVDVTWREDVRPVGKLISDKIRSHL